MRKVKVTLNTTLRGKDTYSNGSVFVGTIAELPEDISKAIEAKKSYITVVELVDNESAPKKADTATQAVKKSTTDKKEGDHTSVAKEPVKDEPKPAIKAAKKRTRKPRTLKSKE